jgi:hypothetical protein
VVLRGQELSTLGNAQEAEFSPGMELPPQTEFLDWVQ